MVNVISGDMKTVFYCNNCITHEGTKILENIPDRGYCTTKQKGIGTA